MVIDQVDSIIQEKTTAQNNFEMTSKIADRNEKGTEYIERSVELKSESDSRNLSSERQPGDSEKRIMPSNSKRASL